MSEVRSVEDVMSACEADTHMAAAQATNAVPSVTCEHRYSYVHTNLVGGAESAGSWCVLCSEPMPKAQFDAIVAERQAPFKHLIGADGFVRLGAKP